MRAEDLYNFRDAATRKDNVVSILRDAINSSRHSLIQGEDASSDKTKLALVLLADIEELISEIEGL